MKGDGHDRCSGTGRVGTGHSRRSITQVTHQIRAMNCAAVRYMPNRRDMPRHGRCHRLRARRQRRSLGTRPVRSRSNQRATTSVNRSSASRAAGLRRISRWCRALAARYSWTIWCRK